MVHVRFASSNSTSSLLPPPHHEGHARRRSTGESPDVQSLERLRQMRSVSSRDSLVSAAGSVGGQSGRRLSISGRRDGRASAESGLPPRPNSAMSSSVSAIHFPSPSSSTSSIGPRSAGLAPPARPRTPKLSGSGGHLPRPTVGQAKAVLLDALDGYDCMLEDKLRVLRRLMVEVQEELIANAGHPSRPSPPAPSSLPIPHQSSHSHLSHHHTPHGLPNGGSHTPPIGDAVRAVKEANKAKAAALAQLQRAVLEQRGPAMGGMPGRR